MYGEFTSHERYGEQYQVKEYERVKPEDKDGVIAFLASDLFPGIGDKMARMIVTASNGKNCSPIFFHPNDNASSIDGVSEK